MLLEINLENIKQQAAVKQQENDVFIEHLRSIDATSLDEKIFELNKQIEPQIDCTTCGNCCKTLMINVEENEAINVANHLQISIEDFKEKYIETSDGRRMLVNTIPCHFLSENKCTIYESRFVGCKEFPALHLPQTQKRLFTIFMHYERCPIIFNVIEHLKKDFSLPLA